MVGHTEFLVLDTKLLITAKFSGRYKPGLEYNPELQVFMQTAATTMAVINTVF